MGSNQSGLTLYGKPIETVIQERFSRLRSIEEFCQDGEDSRQSFVFEVTEWNQRHDHDLVFSYVTEDLLGDPAKRVLTLMSEASELIVDLDRFDPETFALKCEELSEAVSIWRRTSI